MESQAKINCIILYIKIIKKIVLQIPSLFHPLLIDKVRENLEMLYQKCSCLKEYRDYLLNKGKNVLDKENDKSNSTLNIEVEKKVEKVPIVEPKVKNPQNFEKFSSFIYNNDTNKILAVIKDNSTISKNSNIFDRSNLSKLGILHYLSRRITYYCK